VPGVATHKWVAALLQKKITDSYWVMLETIVVLLIVLWLLGVLTSFTVGGLIHVLLVIAVIAILFRLIRGRAL
jgi:hypothetical protein